MLKSLDFIGFFRLFNPDGHPLVSAIIPYCHAIFEASLLENLPYRVPLFISVLHDQGTSVFQKCLSYIKDRTVKIKTRVACPQGNVWLVVLYDTV